MKKKSKTTRFSVQSVRFQVLITYCVPNVTYKQRNYSYVPILLDTFLFLLRSLMCRFLVDTEVSLCFAVFKSKSMQQKSVCQSNNRFNQKEKIKVLQFYRSYKSSKCGCKKDIFKAGILGK